MAELLCAGGISCMAPLPCRSAEIMARLFRKFISFEKGVDIVIQDIMYFSFKALAKCNFIESDGWDAIWRLHSRQIYIWSSGHSRIGYCRREIAREYDLTIHLPNASQKDLHNGCLLTCRRGGWECFFYLALIWKYLTRKLVLEAWACRPGRPEGLPTVKGPAVSPTFHS